MSESHRKSVGGEYRSRAVSLQKDVSELLRSYYSKHKDYLMVRYRIRSFSDFVNFVIYRYLKEHFQELLE
ncbi:MAG: hypothetical protein J7K45_04350 [Thaumarchaeota archaeon]|nr:hypothetical protein [Nitrososphaerota archaeon]